MKVLENVKDSKVRLSFRAIFPYQERSIKLQSLFLSTKHMKK
jgi:hypothetical protein